MLRIYGHYFTLSARGRLLRQILMSKIVPTLKGLMSVLAWTVVKWLVLVVRWCVIEQGTSPSCTSLHSGLNKYVCSPGSLNDTSMNRSRCQGVKWRVSALDISLGILYLPFVHGTIVFLLHGTEKPDILADSLIDRRPFPAVNDRRMTSLACYMLQKTRSQNVPHK